MNFKILFLLFITGSSQVFGQIPDDETTTVAYHKILYGGVGVASTGFSGHLRYGKHITARKKRLYEIEFTTLRSSREVRQSASPSARNYVYGKQYYAYLMRVGIGEQRVLSYKPLGNGVEVKTISSFGLSNSFLKPVYYLIAFFGDNFAKEERFDPESHSPINTIGETSFFNGFGELVYQPGIYGKFALNFEYSTEKVGIKSLETGVVVDAFAKPIQIMAFNNKQNLFVSFYVALQFGQKYYR